MARAKGTALIGAVKMLRKRKDEARALLPEALHRYLSVSVLPASWYPEEDLLKLIRALLEIMPASAAA